MATKNYSIPDLLDGKFYRSESRNISGMITWAEPRPSIWYGENYSAYLIKVRPPYYKGDLPQKDFYATIAVKVGE
jgi:hypothetical protein